MIEDQIERIRAQVGDGRAICGLSGGVDSSVAALLVHRAIGDRLTCVFVDHGLMRKNEGEQVIAAFRDHFKVPLVAVDAADRFLGPAAGGQRPRAQAQADRRRVHPRVRGGGGEARRRALPRPGHALLGRDRVRRRHRRGDDQVPPQRRRPARRPRVRARRAAAGAVQGRGARRRRRARSARAPRLAPAVPGPGAWRSASSAARRPASASDTLREADAILQDEIRKAGLYRELWQSFCVLPDIRTVGVQGDERTYGNVIAIRAVTSDDAMTADWARLPYDLLEQIASRMINEIRPVGRVVLDITSKPPGHDRVGVIARGGLRRGAARRRRPSFRRLRPRRATG